MFETGTSAMFETGNCLYVIVPKNLAPFFLYRPLKKNPLYMGTISILVVRDDIYSIVRL